MALTRPTFQNLNSNLTTFSDALVVSNYGNVANRDIGEVFDRSQGGGSNVAVFWQESTQSFAVAYTTSTGKESGNLTVTSYANLITNNITAGNITAGNLIVANVVYQNTEYVTSAEVVAGNSTVNALTVNNSATIGATLGVTGNIIAGNVQATYFVGNGSLLTGMSTYGNATVASYLPTYSGNLGGTLTTTSQPYVTSLGNLIGLTLTGTVVGTTINAANFGNSGANFTGNVFNIGSASVSGNASASYFIGNGSQLTSITGANVTGTVANASYATSSGSAPTAGTATYVTAATQSNITAVGTLTSLTLSGTMIGTAINAATFGNNGANFTGNIFTMGAASISNDLTVSGITNLGDVSKVIITGGLNNNVLRTDGAGNLTWASPGSGIGFTTNLAPPLSGNVAGDQWYNTATDVLYEYQNVGTGFYWVDITGPSAQSGNTVSLSNTIISGNLLPGVTNTYTLGNTSYKFANAYAVTFNGNVVGNTASYTGNVTTGNIISGGTIYATNNLSLNQYIYSSAVVPGATNYAMGALASVTQLNAASGGTITFNINGTTVGYVNATTLATPNLSTTGTSTITYAPATTTGTALQVFAANTIGGTGYADFLKITNNSTGATNSSKSLRLNSTGALEVINSAYTATLFQIQDNGDSTHSGNLTVNGSYGLTLPNRPAFRIVGNGGVISSGTTVSGGYMVVDYNQGSYLNTTTGLFTAPVAGLYQVNIVVRTNVNNNSGINQIIIRKTAAIGGAVTAQIMIEYGPNTSMNHAGGSTIVKMAVNDTLKFDVTAGNISFDGNDNWSVAYIG